MKLSNRILDSYQDMGIADVVGAVRALEAALEAAYQANRDLTARADRLRYEADVWRDKHAQMSKGRAEAITILTLVYEMREHALRQRIERHQASNVAVHERFERRRAQAAESRATKLAREVATLRVRLAGAIAKIPPGDLWRTPDPVVDASVPATWTCQITGRQVPVRFLHATCKSCANTGTDMCGDPPACGQRQIPAVALEASDGGNRQTEAHLNLADMIERGRAAEAEIAKWPAWKRDIAAQVMGDAPEDLARRRVTERVEDPCADCEATPCDCDVDPLATLRQMAQERKDAEATRAAAIAERDARIAELTRERDEALDYMSGYQGDLAAVDRCLDAIDAPHHPEEGVSLSVTRIRELGGVMHGLRTERDEAIARAERAEQRAEALVRLVDGADAAVSNGVTAAMAASERAERAEAVIAKAKRRVADFYADDDFDANHVVRGVLAILNGKEG